MKIVVLFSKEHEQVLKAVIEDRDVEKVNLHWEVAKRLSGEIPSEDLVSQTKHANYRLLWNRDFLASIDWTKVWP